MAIILSSRSGALDLPVQSALADEMVRRGIIRASEVGHEALGDQLAYRVLECLLGDSVRDGRRPTDAQLKYALDLATKFGVPIPGEAFSSRMAIGTFISSFSASNFRRGAARWPGKTP